MIRWPSLCMRSVSSPSNVQVSDAHFNPESMMIQYLLFLLYSYHFPAYYKRVNTHNNALQAYTNKINEFTLAKSKSCLTSRAGHRPKFNVWQLMTPININSTVKIIEECILRTILIDSSRLNASLPFLNVNQAAYIMCANHVKQVQVDKLVYTVRPDVVIN